MTEVTHPTWGWGGGWGSEGRGGSTTLLDRAVVKLRLGVGGVAPGSVLVPVWIPTVVLRQIGLGMRPRVNPGKSHSSVTGIPPSNTCKWLEPDSRLTWSCAACSRSTSGR